MKRERIGWSLIRTKYYYLFLIILYSCNDNRVRNIVQFPHIIDTIYNDYNTVAYKPKSRPLINYGVHYIGLKKDSLYLSRNMATPYPPSIEKGKPIKRKKRPFIIDGNISDFKSSKDFRIYIDTSQTITTMGWLDEKPVLVKSYPIILENNSEKDTLFFPNLGRALFNLKSVQEERYFDHLLMCGTHSSCFYIPPKNILISAVKKYEGDKPYACQICFRDQCSQNIVMSFDYIPEPY